MPLEWNNQNRRKPTLVAVYVNSKFRCFSTSCLHHQRFVMSDKRNIINVKIEELWRAAAQWLQGLLARVNNQIVRRFPIGNGKSDLLQQFHI